MFVVPCSLETLAPGGGKKNRELDKREREREKVQGRVSVLS